MNPKITELLRTLHKTLNEIDDTILQDKKDEQIVQRSVGMSIHFKDNGEADGVLIDIMDEKFIVELNDSNNGRPMNWNDAHEQGINMPTKKQLQLMYVFKDELNELLLQADGNTMQSSYYWSSTESSMSYCWIVDFGNGYTGTGSKYYTGYVRAVRKVN